jgi:SAM-dependent methyltransferase
MTYVYDNSHDTAGRQHGALSAMLDAFSTSRLRTLGDLAGKRCLEVGAGGSGVPVWLVGQVGATGTVVSTDIKVHRTPTFPGLRVVVHDITTDAIPDGPYDVIHARLLLMHLPERERVLTALARALTPGGALLVEDWYLWPEDAVLSAASAADRDLFTRYQRALLDRVFAANGVDRTWASRIHHAMNEAGLTGVDTAIHAPVWTAGTPGLDLVAVNLAQFRDRFAHAGFTGSDLDRIDALATDPTLGLVVRGHLLFSTLGRRPTDRGE